MEAMACGLPVAAFPVTGPIDVIGSSGAGELDEDLGKASLNALSISRAKVRKYAENFSWEAATDIFVGNLVLSRDVGTSYHFFDNPHKEKRGFLRIVSAAQNSWSGLVFAIREESAFRQELILTAILAPLALWLPATALEKAMMLATLFLVLIVELLNSSIEAAIDRISFSMHGLSKRAKDYGSAAVLLALLLCATCYMLFVEKYLF